VIDPGPSALRGFAELVVRRHCIQPIHELESASRGCRISLSEQSLAPSGETPVLIWRFTVVQSQCINNERNSNV